MCTWRNLICRVIVYINYKYLYVYIYYLFVNFCIYKVNRGIKKRGVLESARKEHEKLSVSFFFVITHNQTRFSRAISWHEGGVLSAQHNHSSPIDKKLPFTMWTSPSCLQWSMSFSVFTSDISSPFLYIYIYIYIYHKMKDNKLTNK